MGPEGETVPWGGTCPPTEVRLDRKGQASLDRKERKTGFQGERRFLSNFFPSPVHLEGEAYPTVEHAFQAAKTLDPAWRERIRQAPTPQEARRLGRLAPLRPGWEEMRVAVMEALLRQKFADPSLRRKLLQVPEEELVEWNTWHDAFWGRCICTRCGGRGQNRLGILLREIRREALKEDASLKGTDLEAP